MKMMSTTLPLKLSCGGNLWAKGRQAADRIDADFQALQQHSMRGMEELVRHHSTCGGQYPEQAWTVSQILWARWDMDGVLQALEQLKGTKKFKIYLDHTLLYSPLSQIAWRLLVFSFCARCSKWGSICKSGRTEHKLHWSALKKASHK